MSSRSLLLQLPRDILHSVYSEWLPSWRDLSRLDVACIGKGDREAWLCSLSELRMIRGESLEGLSEESMRRWYEWVISRKVLVVERFPVLLSVFAYLPAELDFGSYCSYIHSIEIENDLDVTEHALDSNVYSVLGGCSRLYLFVRECSQLKGLRYSDQYHELNDSVFSALLAGLNHNTLQRIFINIGRSRSSNNTFLQLLADHISSMQDLEISSKGIRQDCVDAIMSILSKKRSPLKKLCLSVSHISLEKLLECLSSVGAHLETLQVKFEFMLEIEDYVKGEFLLTLGRSCPQLRILILSASELSYAISMSKIYELYELCPNLISFEYYTMFYTISIIAPHDYVGIRYNLQPLEQYSREEKELFLECICLVIQRSRFNLTVSTYPFCNNLVTKHDHLVLFKSKLSPYLTTLHGVMSESILIEEVKDLPRLENLVINLQEERLTDLSLAAIIEYGYGLKTLCMNSTRNPITLDLCSFTDEMISKVIEGCKMLERLEIPCTGYESVLAVKYHSRLREVNLQEVKASKEELSRLLLVDGKECEEKCEWIRLQNGDISGVGYMFYYTEPERRWSLSKYYEQLSVV